MIAEALRKKLECMQETREVRFAPAPITSEEFLELFGEDDEVELVDGVVISRMAAFWKHEQLFSWLMQVVGAYVGAKDLGFVAGSRSAVVINTYRTRLPDMIFIRKERMNIITDKAIIDAPDWVMEIRSLGDRPSDMVALETDYRTLGVPEIWFIDQTNKRVRVLRKRGEDYEAEELTSGVLRSEVIEGFWLEVEWLFADEYPKAMDVLKRLLAG